jgi:hypothetical protein
MRDGYLFTKDGSEIGSYDNKLCIIKAPDSQHESCSEALIIFYTYNIFTYFLITF